jgi:DNA-binding GntR family transcriptional regulator
VKSEVPLVSERSTRQTSGGAPRRLKRESSADQVAAHIRRLIVSGELAKGERLRQDEIADELGVSRIPVREAIIALDREGWVRFETNRGAYVSGLEIDDIRDHFELRGLVFGLIARRVTETATNDDIKAFVSLLGAMSAATELDEFATLNDRFIGRLIKVARSPRLTAALMVTPAILPVGFFEFVPAGRDIQQRGYRAFVTALASRSADEADSALVTTLRRQGDAVVDAFDTTGLVSGR